jgi:hypothetical protein
VDEEQARKDGQHQQDGRDRHLPRRRRRHAHGRMNRSKLTS